MNPQWTANSGLTGCLSLGVHRTYSITDRSQVVQKTTVAVRSDRARSTVTTLTIPPDSDVRRNL